MMRFLGLQLVGNLLLSVCLNSFAQTFTFDIQQPAANSVVGDSLPMQVSVASTYELQTVTATVEGRSTNLMRLFCT